MMKALGCTPHVQRPFIVFFSKTLKIKNMKKLQTDALAQTPAIELPDTIAEIAVIIKKNWENVYFGAVPYLSAMFHLRTVNDHYAEDSARVVLQYFLHNATTWKGDVARAVKAKLKKLLA
jgi:hypothetical protein